jgi:hypothetical protein
MQRRIKSGNKKKVSKRNGKGLWNTIPPQMKTFSRNIVPPFMRLKLAQKFLFTLATTQSMSRWNPNAAYQPQTGGATGTMPGFSEWAQLYGFYRVYAYSYKLEMSNMEAFPVAVYALNTNNDPGTTVPVTTSVNPLSKSVFLSAKGGNREIATLTGHHSVAAVLGSKAVQQADSYRATVTAIPADVMWLGVGSQSGTGTAYVTGVVCELTLTLDVEFYDTNTQT